MENDSASVDSTMLKAVRYRWHKSDMNNNLYQLQELILMQNWIIPNPKIGCTGTNYTCVEYW